MSLARDEVIALIRRNAVNDAILCRLPTLSVPDAWLVAGCLFQTIWNCRTGRLPNYGIKDYDIFYFDPDTSWEAEDTIIRHCAEALADLNAEIEIRNEARAHLWYPEKFGKPYPKLSRATDGIDFFLAHACKIGVHPRGDGRYDIYAPNGFEDIEAMVLRPNPVPNFQPARYLEKAQRWKTLWPELTVLLVE